MDHEYSVLGGLNRAAIGRYLSIAASAIASLIGASVVSLAEYARNNGYVEQSLMLWPLTAGFIYGALYWFFEKVAWRFELLTKWLRVPNLAGKWQCEGLSTDPNTGEERPWTG